MDTKLLNRTIEILEERHGKDFIKKMEAEDDTFYLQEVIKATMKAHYGLGMKVITKEEGTK